MYGKGRWWDSILEQIRGCDCFIFGLSQTSVNSRACRAELDYAHQLQRPILPVLMGPPVPDQLLPPLLAETQRIDPANPTQLARALLALPGPPPLPDPLPAPPPVPISYMDELADSINREHLTLAEQRDILGTLKARLRDEDERVASIALMERLRNHQDINAWVAEEIDAELARVRQSAAADPAPAQPSAPSPSPPGSTPPAGQPWPPPPRPTPIQPVAQQWAQPPGQVRPPKKSRDRLDPRHRRPRRAARRGRVCGSAGPGRVRPRFRHSPAELRRR